MGRDLARWERIKQLFQAALNRPAADRSAFIRDACGADLGLIAEIESLLEAHASAGNFVEDPAVNELTLSAAAQIETALAVQEASPPPGFGVGERVGNYTVLSLLGSGGMGDVYRAWDPTLGREVAIKVLPAIFMTDPDRLARFEREARMLAALNHPHIATIFGLEYSDGRPALILVRLC